MAISTPASMTIDINEHFDDLISKYRTAFGSTFVNDNQVKTLRKKIPGDRGVYVIYHKRQPNRPIYIGKAGHITANGQGGGRTIRQRMSAADSPYKFIGSDYCFGLKNNKQRKLCSDYRSNYPISDLTIEVFHITTPISPTVVEGILIQAYFNQYRVLPAANVEL